MMNEVIKKNPNLLHMMVLKTFKHNPIRIKEDDIKFILWSQCVDKGSNKSVEDRDRAFAG